MKYRNLTRFWRHSRQLPKEVQELADKNFELLKSYQPHPSLHLEKIGKTKHLVSVRVGAHYRDLGVEKQECIFVVLDRFTRGVKQVTTMKDCH